MFPLAEPIAVVFWFFSTLALCVKPHKAQQISLVLDSELPHGPGEMAPNRGGGDSKAVGDELVVAAHRCK